MTLKPNTSLDLFVATLRDGARFFRDAMRDNATRRGVVVAYRDAADLRAMLLADLQRMGYIDDASPGESTPAIGDLGYGPLNVARQAQGDASIADELRRRELALLQLMGHVLRDHDDLALRRLLKAAVPLVSRLVEAWRRLGLKAHAA